MSGYTRTFKNNDRHKDKKKNKKLVFFCANDDKLLEKYKTIWTKIEDLQNMEFNVLPVYDDRYIRTKIRTYDKVHTNFYSLNVLKDGVECESFTIISIDSLLVYENKYYLQAYLDICAYKL